MGGVSVRFLGSGDAFGSGGRFQTCILVTSSEGATLIDCGASSLIAMKRFGVDPNAIDTVLLSHLHGDHFGGLPFLLLDGQFSRRTRPLTIVGPPGVEARVRAAMEVFFPGSSRTQQRFDVRFVEPAVEPAVEMATVIGPAEVAVFPAEHASGAPAFALRVACDGRTIAYSGDTAWTDSLVRAADGADVFICEAYYYDKQVPYHLDYQTLMHHRASLRCRRLVLTHMSADMLDHIDDVTDECASDGMEIILAGG